MKQKSKKSWLCISLGLALGLILLCAAAVIVIDPFFHYHAPIEALSYKLNNNIERHQNQGIVRHFDYDTIITGSSMTQNFKASECDELFGAKTIKVSCSAARNAETHNLLTDAFEANNAIRRVIFSLDYIRLIVDPEDNANDIPEYLLNDVLYDDVKYFLNLDILTEYTLPVIGRSLRNESGIDFDSYSRWNEERPCGAEYVLRNCYPITPAEETVPLTDEERELLRENINDNFLSIIEAHPETEFYIFFPPYSICYWRMVTLRGELDRWLEAEREAAGMLLSHPNVQLLSFSDCFDITTDLNNYSDTIHYEAWVNSLILRSMKDGTHRLTADNLEDYSLKLHEFYSSYDYNSIYPQEV